MSQPATRKQLQYIAHLSHRAGMSHSASHGIAAVLGAPQQVDSDQASRVIEDLKTRTPVIRSQHQLARLTFTTREPRGVRGHPLFHEVTTMLRNLGAQHDPATGAHHIASHNARRVLDRYARHPRVSITVLFPQDQPEAQQVSHTAARRRQEQQEHLLRTRRGSQRAHLAPQERRIVQDTLDQLNTPRPTAEPTDQWQAIARFAAGIQAAASNQRLGIDTSTARWAVRWENAAQQHPQWHQPQLALDELRTAIQLDLDTR